MNKKIIKVILIIIILIHLIIVFLYLNIRKYIKFTYICESNYTNLDYFDDYDFPDNCEFTWWWDFPLESVDSIEFIDEKFGTKFKERLENMNYTIDKNKQDIIISFGRKLKTIYYDETINPNGKGRYSHRMIIGVPVFEKEYSPKIYLYTIDKKYNIYPMEFWGDDIIQFNRYGNVRFEEE